MVEFLTGKNIKSKTTKVIIAKNTKDVLQKLSDNEKFLENTIKKQVVEDKIREYCCGGYTLFVYIVDKMSDLCWQHAGAKVYAKIKNYKDVKVEIVNGHENDFCNFALGVELSSYRFDKYFTKKPSSFYPNLEKITFVGIDDFSCYKENSALVNSVRYARDLINEPSNYLTPMVFADDIKRLEYLGIEITILDEIQMQALGFNLALSVAQGSVNKPRVAILKWHGNKQSQSYKVGLIGKGVTFDSGGISIKPAANMWDMKQDMAGAGAIVATMKSLALQQVEKNVVAVVGLVENMPSGSATRPGDIVTSMSGQTVEIQNTDAEGRLVLADCLTYIQKEFKPEYVIDMATLTGAIVVALGNTFAGLFSNSSLLIKKLSTAGEESGERLWNMPLDEEYNKLIDSTIADMKNLGGRCAGSATAACFLQRFINKNTKWAHLDIAGMDLADGSKDLYPKGASGFGVCLLNKFVNEI